MPKRLISTFVCFTFVFTNLPLLLAQNLSISELPLPGNKIGISKVFCPTLIKGLIIHPKQPLNFDFILDTGNDAINPKDLKIQSERMIKYFLAALTIPEDALWVNLSPYEKNRIIDQQLGQTVLGRDMLGEDYILKQFTASLIDPQDKLGQKFWKLLYSDTKNKTAMRDLTVNTFNKVWIVPQRAVIFEKNNSVYITQAHLKVMLDSDYLAMAKNKTPDQENNNTNTFIRQLLLPVIEQEVNEGKNFSTLRQVFYAAILAKWYRQEVEDTLISQNYVGKNKLTGITNRNKQVKEEIYQRYISAYKKGVFNFIKEDNNPQTGALTARKYFSGGLEDFAMRNISLIKTTEPPHDPTGRIYTVNCAMSPDRAMLEESTTPSATAAAAAPARESAPDSEDSEEMVSATKDRITEIVAAQKEAWDDPHLHLTAEAITKLIDLDLVKILQDKYMHVIKGVLLTYPIDSKILDSRGTNLWQNMLDSRILPGVHDTVLFWSIGVPKSARDKTKNYGQKLAALARDYYLKLYLHVRTWSPLMNSGYDYVEFIKKLRLEFKEKDLDPTLVDRYGIYLYLASSRNGGPWPYLHYLQQLETEQKPLETPEQFFRTTNTKMLDAVANFHVFNNGANISQIIYGAITNGYPRSDSPITVSYQYDHNFNSFNYSPYKQILFTINSAVNKGREKADAAQLNGGIDINNIALTRSRNRIKFTFDDLSLEEITDSRFSGLTPKIRRITAVKSLDELFPNPVAY